MYIWRIIDHVLDVDESFGKHPNEKKMIKIKSNVIKNTQNKAPRTMKIKRIHWLKW